MDIIYICIYQFSSLDLPASLASNAREPIYPWLSFFLTFKQWISKDRIPRTPFPSSITMPPR